MSAHFVWLHRGDLDRPFRKERSKVLSIRGEYTARRLEGLGITNFKITGCPSNFINLDPDLAEKIDAKMKHPMRSFITHGDEPWPKMNRRCSTASIIPRC